MFFAFNSVPVDPISIDMTNPQHHQMEVDHLWRDITQKEDFHPHSPRSQDSHREDQGLEGCLVVGCLMSVGCELNGVHNWLMNDENPGKSVNDVSFWVNVYGMRDDSVGVVEKNVVDDEETMKVILYLIGILQEWVMKA